MYKRQIYDYHGWIFFFKQKTAYEITTRLVGSEMCIRDSSKIDKSRNTLQETSDQYARVLAQLCATHRVITCRESIQWILQRRKKGGAERSWRAVGYYRTKSALIQACATLCGRIDPTAMAILLALPSHFGGGQ